MRLVFTIVISRGWLINQLYFYNAFLNEILYEEMYMEQPSGFSHSTLSFHVCRLYKSIYSLKETSGKWYTKLSDYLCSLIFYASKVDTSLFILVMGDAMSFLRMYMDDFLLTRSNLLMFKH